MYDNLIKALEKQGKSPAKLEEQRQAFRQVHSRIIEMEWHLFQETE